MLPTFTSTVIVLLLYNFSDDTYAFSADVIPKETPDDALLAPPPPPAESKNLVLALASGVLALASSSSRLPAVSNLKLTLLFEKNLVLP